MTLSALCLALWTALSPAVARTSDAREIAAAIERAVSGDTLPPVFGSREADARVMARYAYDESRVQIHPPHWLDPVTGLPVDSRAFGPWQSHVPESTPLDVQARRWLAALHEGARICPASPAAPLSGGCARARRLADRRVAAALR